MTPIVPEIVLQSALDHILGICWNPCTKTSQTTSHQQINRCKWVVLRILLETMEHLLETLVCDCCMLVWGTQLVQCQSYTYQNRMQN